MVPSGYKEDTVYSVVPSDGSGDLSFTRASNGTRINSAGLVEVTPWNLLQYSEDFANTSIWTQDAAGTGTISVTANYGVAPNGTTTADRVQMTKGSIYTQIYQTMTVISGAQYTLSVYLKSLSGTPTITTLYNTAVAGTKTLTTEWVRYDFTFIAASSTIYPMIALYGSDSASMDVLAWGYQLNIGSTAKPYFPTTDRLNVPRLTYQNGGGGCPSLLLEKQSTNSIFPSNGDNGMAFNGTFTANATTSPEGVSNAFSFLVTSNSNGGLSMVTITTSAQSYTFSAYLKGSVNGQKVLLLGDLNGSIQEFTLTTDWVRYTKTFTGSVGAQSIYLLNGSYLSPAQNNLYYGYGLQLEASSYATSLIPTTSASATRVADACSKTGISSLIGQTEGTLFVDFVWEGLGTANVDNPIFSIGEQSYGTSNIAIANYNSALYGRLTNGTSVDAGIAFGAMTIGTRYKCAIGYASNDFVFYVNGANYGNDTSVSIPALSDAYFQNDYPNSKEVNQAILFKTRLTNAELASLTTL